MCHICRVSKGSIGLVGGITCVLFVVAGISLGLLLWNLVRLGEIGKVLDPENPNLEEVDCWVVNVSYVGREECELGLEIEYSNETKWEVERVEDSEECWELLNSSVLCVYDPEDPDDFVTELAYNQTLNDYGSIQEEIETDTVNVAAASLVLGLSGFFWMIFFSMLVSTCRFGYQSEEEENLSYVDLAPRRERARRYL